MSSTYTLIKGSVPLLISMPHNGQEIPEELAHLMTAQAKAIKDTDWYIDRLYDFAQSMGAYIIKPKYSRYVIDLNREPNGINLYPNENSTELCPTTSFDLSPLYLNNNAPNKDDVAQRIQHYWQPYHQALRDTLVDIKSEFGQVVLLDAHSILSVVPRFFEGQLPDFNFGTNNGQSCNQALISMIENVDYRPYSTVTNGRFKGGFITREYGNPQDNIHAVQLELSQRTYLHETLFEYDEKLATEVKKRLHSLVQCLIHFAQTTAPK